MQQINCDLCQMKMKENGKKSEESKVKKKLSMNEAW